MKYDLIIIGGGPAGLNSAIYAGRYKLNALVLSKNMGGVAATAYKICNFPSYIEIRGFEFMQKMIKQVENLGVPIKYEEVIKIEKKANNFKVSTKKSEYECKKIIYAGGTERIRLDVPGEGKFLWKGVSYCANCDASFFKNKKVAVVGGSDAALTSALLLSEFANKVYIIYRKDNFYKAEPAWMELVKKEKKIETIFNEEILEIIGKENVESIKLKSGKNMKIDGVFIETGSVPSSELASSIGVKINDNKYIITERNQETNVKGFFAAGDVTSNSLKQIIVAAAEGAVAALGAYQQIKKEV